MKYTALIFDFFDVIYADPLQTWLRAHGWKREGAVHAASIELDSGRIDLAGFLQLLGKATGQPVAEIQREHKASERLNQPVVTYINQLRKYYKVALLSNGHGEIVRSIIARNTLQELFDHVVISSEIGHLKPSAEAFHHVLGQLNVLAAQAIFIDDNPKNVAGAEAVGIRGLVFTSLKQLQSDLATLGITLPPAT